MTVAEFLTARLDEEEAALRAIQDNSEPWRGEWDGDDEANFALRTRNGWSLARAVTVEAGFPPGVLAHLVRYDPARALREIEAKRRIIARHYMVTDDCIDGDGIERAAFICHECDNFGKSDNWPCPTVRALAAIWSDHPDYDQSWAVKEEASGR